MQPIIHPESILLVHQTMIREELRRRYPEDHLYTSNEDQLNFRNVERGERALPKVRRFISSGLIAAGNRLDPARHQDAVLAGHASK